MSQDPSPAPSSSPSSASSSLSSSPSTTPNELSTNPNESNSNPPLPQASNQLSGLLAGYPIVFNPNSYPWTNVPTETINSFPLPMDTGTMNLDQISQNVAWMSNLLQFQLVQQLYAQYLAQHMNQSVQQQQMTANILGDDQLLASTVAVPSTAQNNNNNNGAQAQEQPRLEPQAPAAAARLNPPPAAAIADDEDDPNQRDWLDWFSYITRAVALLSFIYLYASFSRFLIVTCLYLLVRLYIRVFNGVPENPMAVPGRWPVAAQPQANADANNRLLVDGPNQLQQVMDGNIDGHRERNDGQRVTNNNNNDNNNNGPTKIRLLLIMVKALFTSLIPVPAPPL